MKHTTRRALRVFSILALLLTHNAFASAATSFVFDGQGFSKTTSCVLNNEAAIAVPEALKDLNASVRMVKFAPLENEDGSALSLDGSTWQTMATSLTTSCGQSKDTYYPVQVTLANSNPLQVFVTQENSAALVDLLAEFSKLPVASGPLQFKTMSVEVVDGSVDDVICTSSSSLNVRDAALKKVIFTAARLESIKKSQTWETSEQTAKISGKTYSFIEVQFSTRNNTVGWVATDFIKNRTECGGAATPAVPVDNNVYVFPTKIRPSSSYLTGQRAFGSSRSGGARRHAANDIYRLKGEPVVAVGSGTVIRDMYAFYEGTYALEVKQADGRIVRYGEITGTRAPNIKSGAVITPGQTLGYVGKVNSGCCTPMLHFELYSGKSTGPLTQSGNKYVRRSDLVSPTADLRSWEKKTFGVSY